jgi:peptidoglycan-N-acetylglucosamine deacetylase
LFRSFRSKVLAAAIPAALVVLGMTACSADTSVSKNPLPTRAPASPKPKPRTKATPKPSPAPTRPTMTVQPAHLPQAWGLGPAGSLRATGNSSVALTFDDGPDPKYTPLMLDLLKKHKVKATFCVIGWRARDYPWLIKRIVADGHTLCNHTWDHNVSLGTETDAVILKDLQDTNDAIHRAAPRSEIEYFRAPGGRFNPHLVGLAKSLGMRSIYWTIDTRDWDKHTFGVGVSMVYHIVSTVLAEARRGAIVLAHDLRKPDTLGAFRMVLPWLKRYFKLRALPT